MRILKNLLAWLDWSTYASKGSYSFPKSLCPLFWRSLFGIIFIPFIWITHVWNLILVKMADFRDEYVPSYKIHAGHGTLMHFSLLFLGTISEKKFIEEEFGYNFINISDNILIMYGKVLLLGLSLGLLVVIFFGLAVLIIGGVVELFNFIKDTINDTTEPNHEDIYDDNGNYVKTIEHEPKGFFFQIKKLYKSLKDNYCPRIDWTDVKNK
jgi:hypothetical protein